MGSTGSFEGRRLGASKFPRGKATSGDFTLDYFEEHRPILGRLGVAADPQDDGVECRFTDEQAKAFLLLHVFLHEPGHHVDRMQSKQQSASRRGEPFAERYANELSVVIWPDYIRISVIRGRSGSCMPKARQPGARSSRLMFAAGIALKVVLSLIVYAMPILGFWLASSLAAYRGGATSVPLVAGLVAFPLAPLIWDLAADIAAQTGDTRERFLPFSIEYCSARSPLPSR